MHAAKDPTEQDIVRNDSGGNKAALLKKNLAAALYINASSYSKPENISPSNGYLKSPAIAMDPRIHKNCFRRISLVISFEIRVPKTPIRDRHITPNVKTYG